MCCNRKQSLRGFTLIELVVMMTIIGILAVTAIPRCFAPETFNASGFRDQAASALRYAHTVAIASECPVTFTTSGNSFTLTQGGGGCAAITLNGPDGTPFTATTASGVTITNGSVTFNPDGSASAAVTFTVQGGGFNPGGTPTPNITVIAATGYVQVN